MKKSKCNQHYADLQHTVLSHKDHISLMWGALELGAKNNECLCTKEDNGAGLIHVFDFTKLGFESPNFQTISDDIFNQIKIL